MTGKLQAALPSHIPVDRFKRVVLTAVNLNPDLLNADRRSLFNAASKAAADGLVPDGREGALVIYKDWKTNREIVQWMPMVQGLLKLIRQSGEIAAISARCVYENEVKEGRFEFKIVDGEEHLRHDPILFGERGKLVGVYATAKFKDGTTQHEPLTAADIAKIRAASMTGKAEKAGKTPKGPWVDWEDEMWRKSALRRLRKYLPTSAEDQRVVSALDRDFAETDADQVRAIAAQPQSIASAAAALSAAPTTIDAGDGEQADAETGEIIEGDATSGGEGQTNGADGEDEGSFAEEQKPVITHIACPMHEGMPVWKDWHAAAMGAIPQLTNPAMVDAWIEAHAAELDGVGRAKKTWRTEIEEAAKKQREAVAA